ncbi:DUF721 domain-containing protein [Neiella marina]|uniref:DUF721 domain-containing protein n=1 Tax=Neiella holothuriorum TaxID=2870530 RepID=A0ABS7EB40_9GAMM|nr:DUF721 domain-containing protein [Neiella holothuriorum]MBW8189542.1 DUF721 domain-containing protein [Neiella holothuriorum]
MALSKLFQGGRSELANIARHSQSLTTLQEAFANALDVDLAPHCHLVRYQNGVLTAHVDSAVWQWRFNMNKVRIIANLRQQGFRALTTLESHVKPRTLPSQTKDSGFKVNRIMTHQSASDLRALAESSPEPLKSQLLKLAAHEKTKPA